MRRVIVWLVLALLGVLLLPVTVSAQGPGITMEAQALYEGTSKYGEWLPVVVDLENSGDDVSGQVQVRVSASGEETLFAQRLELPRGARKQVMIYTVPNNFSRRLEVEFIADGEAEALVTAEADVRPVPNIRFIVAALSAGGDGLEPLIGLNFRGTQGPRDQSVLVPLTLATLPDRPEALRTLDMLVLSGVDTSSLTPRQQAALEQFVSLGGMLVLGGGPEANRVLAGIPEALQPVTLAGDGTLESLPALEALTGEAIRVSGPFPVAQAEPAADATVRFRQEALPLLVERQVGRGVVYWLALDPSLTPFDAWAGTDEFWLSVVGDRAFHPRDMPTDISPRQMINEQLYYALQNLPSLDLPSLRLLVPLLALYILIVGPVNYFALRRTRRMELAWVTIPVITLLFSAGAYGLGYGLRGSDVIVNQVAVVQGVPGGEGGYVRSVIGVFSPSRRTYDLTISNEALVAPSRIPGDPFAGGTSNARQAVILQGEPALVENFTVNQWSMQSVTAESLATEGYGFDSDLSVSDGRIVGTIANRSAYDWHDVVVILGSNFERVGEMPRGESVQLSFEAENVGQPGGDVVWRIFEQAFNTPTGASRDVQVKQQVLSSLYGGSFGSSSLAYSTQPVLVAWLDATPTQVSLSEDSRVSQVGTTLLYSEMPVRFGAGAVSLPRGMLRARIVQNDGGTCYGPGVASLSPDFEEAEIQWELPNQVKQLDPSELALHISSDGGWANTPALAFYDYEAGGWVEVVEPVMGQNKVAEPDALLSDNGILRLRVQNPNRNQGGCLYFDVALKGTLLDNAVGILDR